MTYPFSASIFEKLLKIVIAPPVTYVTSFCPIIIIFFIHKPSGYLIQIHPAHRRAAHPGESHPKGTGGVIHIHQT